MKRLSLVLAVMTMGLMAVGCSDDNETTGGPLLEATGEFVVVAWNDLGMHCLNPTYSDAVILPPYNTVWAQVIRRGDPPTVYTTGLTVTYRIMNNTYSAGKTDELGGDFSQFWDNCEAVFGVDLALDTGLNLADPGLHNGLNGSMVKAGDHFVVHGIPLVPVNDAGTWNPYQVIEVTVRNSKNEVVAQTQATAPTSDEIDCAACHGQGGTGTVRIGGGEANPFLNILAAHDALHGTTLVAERPVLCARCHASPALGGTTDDAATYLSAVIHQSHADRNATCYSCHPGELTKCSRSYKHRGEAGDGNCTSCHGSMAEVGGSVAAGNRVPWAEEPACSDCHDDLSGVATGGTLYRNATGHGGIYCAVCHGSPHAMAPSTVYSDDHQYYVLQGKPLTLGSCRVCHDDSWGPDTDELAGEFLEEHGGLDGRRTACHVCHTQVNAVTADWPHQAGMR